MLTMCLYLMGCGIEAPLFVVDFIIVMFGSALLTMELVPIMAMFIVALIMLTYLKGEK